MSSSSSHAAVLCAALTVFVLVVLAPLLYARLLALPPGGGPPPSEQRARVSAATTETAHARHRRELTQPVFRFERVREVPKSPFRNTIGTYLYRNTETGELLASWYEPTKPAMALYKGEYVGTNTDATQWEE